MSIVNQYDTSFSENMTSERWYRDFWKSLSGKTDIFNLNYNNTIENSLGEYEDGFPPVKIVRNIVAFQQNAIMRTQEESQQ